RHLPRPDHGTGRAVHAHARRPGAVALADGADAGRAGGLRRCGDRHHLAAAQRSIHSAVAATAAAISSAYTCRSRGRRSTRSMVAPHRVHTSMLGVPMATQVAAATAISGAPGALLP